MEEWYESMDRIQDSKAKLVNEQSANIRDEWFIEGDPDEIKMKEPEETGIIIGETIIEESYPTSSESEELTESEIIVLGSDESDENQ